MYSGICICGNRFWWTGQKDSVPACSCGAIMQDANFDEVTDEDGIRIDAKERASRVNRVRQMLKA